MADPSQQAPSLLWSNGPIEDSQAWAHEMQRLLDLEKVEEMKEVELLKGSLSPQEAEDAGISLPFIRVLEKSNALFGRSSMKVGKGEIPLPSTHRFRVGSEVSIIPSKMSGVSMQGVVSKIGSCFIEVIVNRDDMSYELINEGAAIRLDQLPSEITHRRLSQSLKNMLHYDSGIASTEGLNNNERRVDAGVVSLRRVLLGLQPPTTQGVDSSFKVYNQNLDQSQQDAISFALRSNDVSLIHGPPGTGKTTTMVELLLQAVLKKGYRVLMIAPSNVAVDNLLERLVAAAPAAEKEQKSLSKTDGGDASTQRIKAIRLGHPARQSEGVLRHSLDAVLARTDGMEVVAGAREELSKLQQGFKKKHTSYEHKAMQQQQKELRKDISARERKVFKEVLNNCNVVCCTCIGAASSCLSKVGVFDLCVIDEAAMALEVACWVPILRARKLVLAGDHKQLPPTIKCDAAARGGLYRTLFERIIEMYGDKVARMLGVQYRMNQVISNWASEAMYKGELMAGDSVAHHLLGDLPHVDGHALDSEGAMVFFDTAGCDMYEDSDDASEHGASGAADNHRSLQQGMMVMSRSNKKEAGLVVKYAESLIDAGVNPYEIAVITPYNGQVDAVRALFAKLDVEKGLSMPTYATIEVRSVDGFQGGEREVVLLSLVRSNARHEVGFVKDERRLNVAVTRARRHCVLFGDSDTFSETPSVSDLMTYVCEHGTARCALELLELNSLPSGGATTLTLEDVSGIIDSKTKPKTEHQKRDTPSEIVEAPLTKPISEVVAMPKEAESIPPIVDLLSGWVADLSLGSAYLAHRPKSVVVELKVKYKNRVGSVRACTEEDVSCFRRRVATLFELGKVYLDHPANQVQSIIKLMYKGVLADSVKLGDTNVRSNATVTLMVSGGYKVSDNGDDDSDFSDVIITNKIKRYAEAGVQVEPLRFPSSLNSAQRALIHETCEQLNLAHFSSGEGKDRFITVSHETRQTQIPVSDTRCTGVSGSSTTGAGENVSNKAIPNQKAGGVDLKALHFERMNRQKKDSVPRTPQTPEIPASSEWGEVSLPTHKTSGSKKKSKKKKTNNKSASFSQESSAPSDSAAILDVDDDMLLLDSLIQSQQLDKEKSAEKSKSDPSYGWKRWVDADGVLKSNVSHEEERKSNALKSSMKSKINEKQAERSTKTTSKKK